MKRFLRPIGQWALSIHIYLSMTGFLLILLFAITGITLNHADLGLRTRVSETTTLALPEELVGDLTEQKLVGHLRNTLNVTSPVSLYKEFPDEIEVLFAAPGSRTHVVLNRGDQTATVESETRGLLGKLEDLHKGHDSGRVWSWTIDLTAILLATSAVTGITTLASLPARRRVGFLFGAAGLVIALFIYWGIPA